MKETLESIAAAIELGYGYVGDSMLRIYSDDEGLDWEETKAWFDSRYEHKKVHGEMVWNLAGVSWDQIKKEYKDYL